MPPVALTIAGSDPSGGAGLQADLKTFHQFGVYGEAVVTLITVQNTVRVSRVEVLPAALVIEQLEAVLEDIPPAAAKTGALGSESAARAVRELLLPRAALVTPNLPEAEALTGIAIRGIEDMRAAALRIHAMGARAVLIKGGHLENEATDLLFDGAGWREFPAPRIPTRHTHGTGCTYSAAITAGLARGLPLDDAVARAKLFIQAAIQTNPGLGQGSGPVNHHAEVSWNPMTKVQIRFRLSRPLDSVLLPRIAQAHAVYGIERVTLAPSLDSVTVEYDATRLNPAEVESALTGVGIPIAPELA
jgi:hydroxymethylpyrimidine/phosphomethylpyrimidine kinase